MRKNLFFSQLLFLSILILFIFPLNVSAAQETEAVAKETRNTRAAIKLGNEILLESYFHLIEGENVGLVANQTGVDSRGITFTDILAVTEGTKLTALYALEHGIDGVDRAGAWVVSYLHPKLGIPVYSLYGATRMPSQIRL